MCVCVCVCVCVCGWVGVMHQCIYITCTHIQVMHQALDKAHAYERRATAQQRLETKDEDTHLELVQPIIFQKGLLAELARRGF